MFGAWSAQSAVGLAVALGCGLLIGLERERRKGQGPSREAAGIRSFAVVALAGAIAQSLEAPGLVAIGALLVVGLAVVSYQRSHRQDPGLTTELALFATYLIGVQAVLVPAIAAASGVALAALLAARERLHRFATELLSEQELHDGLLLAALVLIALPVLPAGPVPALGGLDLRRVVALVVLILAVQAAGHVALRAFGARGGLPLAGFLSGFVSSTATVATLGRRVRAEPTLLGPLSTAAGLSGSATWVLAGMIVAAVAPAHLGALLPMFAAGALLPLVLTLRSLAHRGDGATQSLPAGSRPLRPREALGVAALLLGVSWGVSQVQQSAGAAAGFAAAAIAALADAHSAVAALSGLAGEGRLDRSGLALGVLIAVASNTALRIAVAALAGGAHYAAAVGLALLASLAAAAGASMGLLSV